MRLIPIVPLVLGTAAFILAFLCIFAGTKTDLLQDYSILTLNISRIGQDISSTLFDKRSANPLVDLISDLEKRDIIDSISSAADSIQDSVTGVASDTLNALEGKVDNVTDTIQQEAEDLANDAAASIAKGLGFKDFYSVFIMNYCQGYYTPGPIKNATVKDIDKNVTSCRDPSAMFAFDPTQALVTNLNETVNGSLSEDRAQQILEAVDWPEDLQDSLDDLSAAFKATAVMYYIAIAFTGLLMLSCIFWFLRDGRFGPLLVISFGSLAFLFMAVGSAIATAIAVKGAHYVNKYGNRIGIEGQRGTGYLGLTWAATACLFIAAIAGCVGCFGVRKRSVRTYSEKP